MGMVIPTYSVGYKPTSMTDRPHEVPRKWSPSAPPERTPKSTRPIRFWRPWPTCRRHTTAAASRRSGWARPSGTGVWFSAHGLLGRQSGLIDDALAEIGAAYNAEPRDVQAAYYFGAYAWYVLGTTLCPT